MYSSSPSTVKEIVNTRLWDNKFICIDNKPVHYNSWSVNCINLVGHIFKTDGTVMTKVEIENKYNFTIKDMDYNSLVHAIPTEWKKLLKGKNAVMYIHADYCYKIHINKVAYNVSTLKCKDFYWEFVSSRSELPKSEEKWAKYLEAEQLCWEDYYTIPFKVTRETYLQSFQYKIFHRFYPCNYTLSIWYEDHSANCKHCTAIDYLEHFFFTCNNVKAFWLAIENWWSNTLNVTINLSTADAIFGIQNVDNDNNIDVLNLTILLAKYYIHVKKSNDQDLCLFEFIKLVKDKLEIEKAVCKIAFNDTFDKRWSFFYEML